MVVHLVIITKRGNLVTRWLTQAEAQRALILMWPRVAKATMRAA